jgi:hypothetical protein
MARFVAGEIFKEICPIANEAGQKKAGAVLPKIISVTTRVPFNQTAPAERREGFHAT